MEWPKARCVGMTWNEKAEGSFHDEELALRTQMDAGDEYPPVPTLQYSAADSIAKKRAVRGS